MELFVSPDVGDYLQNEKRAAIAHIEQTSDKRVIIHSSPNTPAKGLKLSVTTTGEAW